MQKRPIAIIITLEWGADMTKSLESLEQEIAELIVEAVNLEGVDSKSIGPEEALFGDGLGLDSIDALEIGVAISQRYNLKFKSQDEETSKHFASIRSLALFIEASAKEHDE